MLLIYSSDQLYVSIYPGTYMYIPVNFANQRFNNYKRDIFIDQKIQKNYDLFSLGENRETERLC